MRKYLAIVFCLVWLPAQAEQWLVTTGADYPPYTGPDLPNGGIATEVLVAAMASVGDQLSIEWLPWKRGYEETKSGRIDATFPYVENSERSADFLFSKNLFAAEVTAFVRRSESWNVEGLFSQGNLIFCNPIGYSLWPQAQSLVEEGRATLAEPQSFAECFKMIANRSADVGIIDRRVGIGEARRGLGGDYKVFLKPLVPSLGINSNHVIVSKNHPRALELIKRINLGISNIQKSGLLDDLLNSNYSGG